ncbi:MAG: SCO family protein [Candidatus Acidiferrales bacterium]
MHINFVRNALIFSAIFTLMLIVTGGVRAQDILSQNPSGKPEVLDKVGLDQKLNSQIPLDLTFRDEQGKTVTLRQLMNGKPAILELVYYMCPMLCTEVLNGTLNSLKEIPLDIGKDFTVITVSIDPREKPDLANAKQTMYTGIYGRPGASQGWHFLTGDEPQIKQLAESVGYRYVYDPVSQQFAHAAGIMVLTPEGRISHYLFGIGYRPRDVRLALIEASSGKIGSPLQDAVLLYCFHYDPATGKYGLVIGNILHIAGLLTVLLIAGGIIVMLRREKQSVAGAGPQSKTAQPRTL